MFKHLLVNSFRWWWRWWFCEELLRRWRRRRQHWRRRWLWLRQQCHVYGGKQRKVLIQLQQVQPDEQLLRAESVHVSTAPSPIANLPRHPISSCTTSSSFGTTLRESRITTRCTQRQSDHEKCEGLPRGESVLPGQPAWLPPGWLGSLPRRQATACGILGVSP